MQLDADLRVLVATSSAERQALGNLTATAGLPLPVAPTATPPASPWFYVLMSGLVMATVSIVVAVSAVFWSHSKPTIRPVAQSQDAVKSTAKDVPGNALKTAAPNDLIQLVRQPQQVAALYSASGDASWSEGARYQVGQLLPQGTHLELRTGTAQISMTCGADVVLQSPCSIVLMDDRLVQLLTGKLTVQVAKWATGFVVEARGLKITDLGTRFAVSAESHDSTEAHVLDGSVLAKSLQPGREHEKPLLLRSGEAIRVNTSKGEFDRFEAEGNRFVDQFHNVRPYRTLDLPNTGKGFVIGYEDSNWRITAGPKSIGPWPQPAFVTLPNVRYLDNAPENSQWISVKGGTRRSVPRNKVFTFETTFDLTGFDPTTVSVVAQILADNGVKAMRLNGKPVSIEPWVDNMTGQKFQTFHVVEIRKGFVRGINRIEIDVFNGISAGYRSPNPMALRVEWQAFGCSDMTEMRNKTGNGSEQDRDQGGKPLSAQNSHPSR
ncbi:MAG: FecR domain-containing protein [Pirellulales bacterium]|nr:FecR domain-containing protein [Pirellulales bacterium]